MKLKKKWVFLIIAVAAVLIGGFFFLESRKNQPIARGDTTPAASATGTLAPEEMVDISSQVTGKVARVYVDFNDAVKKDQVLAELDPSQVLAGIKQIEAQIKSIKIGLSAAKRSVDYWTKRLERADALIKKGFISQQEKDDVDYNFEAAKNQVDFKNAELERLNSQLDSANVDLERVSIKSPIDGIVISRNVSVGQTIIASFQSPTLFQIARDLKVMQIKINVLEKDIGKVRQGQDVQFTVPAFKKEAFSGKVVEVQVVTQIVDGEVTYPVIVRVDNTDMRLKPGMTAKVIVAE